MTSISDTTRPMCANFRFGTNLAAASCVIAPPRPSDLPRLNHELYACRGSPSDDNSAFAIPKSEPTASRQSLTRSYAAQEYLERSGCFPRRVYIDVMSCIADRHQVRPRDSFGEGRTQPR